MAKADAMAAEVLAYFRSTALPYAGVRLDCGGAPPDTDSRPFVDALVRCFQEAQATLPSIRDPFRAGAGTHCVHRTHVTRIDIPAQFPATYATLDQQLSSAGINGGRDGHFLIVVVPHTDSGTHGSDSLFEHHPRDDDARRFYSWSLPWYLGRKMS